MPTAESINLPAWMGSRMVLQAGMKNTIKGSAEPGAGVSIILEQLPDNSGFSRAAEDKDGVMLVWRDDMLTDKESGVFSFSLPEIEASYNHYRLTIRYAGYEYLFENILFGEVWIAAGESNMAMPASYSDLDDDLPSLYNMKGIRIFMCNESGLLKKKREYSFKPQRIIPGANWFDSSSREDVRRCSAVALSFAAELQKNLDCPVGIYDIACSETGIHAWLPHLLSEKDTEINRHLRMLGYYRDERNYNEPQSEESKQAFQRAAREKERDSAYVYKPFTLRNQPGAIYNHKLAPLRDLGIQGFLWYQGESDENYPDYYAKIFKNFGEMLAAFFTSPENKVSLIYSQLAPYYYSAEDPCHLAYFNEVLTASRHRFNQMPGLRAGMVTVYDLPLAFHEDKDEYQGWARALNPIAKKEVGRRMAEVALGLAYRDILPPQRKTCDSAPELTAVDISERQMTLQFDNTAEGINPHTSYGHLSGFSAAGEDGIFAPCTTNAVLGVNALLTSESVKNPVSCNYAFASYNQDADCINSRGLPLVPFRFSRDPEQIYLPAMPWAYCDKTEIWALARDSEKFSEERKKERYYPKKRPLWEAVSGMVSFELSRDDYYTSDASLLVNYRRMGDKPVIFGPILDYLSLYPPLDISLWREVKIIYKTKTRISKYIALRLVAADGEKTIDLPKQRIDTGFSWQSVSFLLLNLPSEFTKISAMYIMLEEESREGSIYIDQIRFAGIRKAAAGKLN